ncbi:hypothetical protein [Empedobacter falsenii]|uniref:hypothetical protein n=1 Tax=Empedobacter falsenii TaxID=343874 RepID=UPI001C594573|nr:hypothetical protein [Empedobacter falsenii]MBW1618157.1 hypothetical protein [Empedobacter falsenii]
MEIKLLKNNVTLILLFFSSYIFSQNVNVCNYSNSNISEIELIFSSTPNDRLILEIVNEIEESIGVQNNFIVINKSDFNNCAALNYFGSRVIIYDFEFLKRISNNKRYVITSILAHEIAHHLLNHTLIEARDLEASKRNELEADYLSGVIMKKLGYSLNESIEGINKLQESNDDFFSTHPIKQKRDLIITQAFDDNEYDINSYIDKILKLSKYNSLTIINSKNYDRGINLINNSEYSKALIELDKLSEIDEFLYLIGAIRKVEIYRNLYSEELALNELLKLETRLNSPNFIINKFSRDHKNEFIANYLYFNIGGSYELLNEKEKSIKYYEKAFSFLPDDKIIKAKIGILNYELKNYESAINYLNDNDIEKLLVENNFSPVIFKKFFFSRIDTALKLNYSFKEMGVIYDNILSNYSANLNEDDLIYIIKLYSEILIYDFNKNDNVKNEYKINRFYIKFKQIKDPSKENSKDYLNIILKFYRENEVIYDRQKRVQEEITSYLNAL